MNLTNLTFKVIQNKSDFSLPITINQCKEQCLNHIQNLPTTNQTSLIIVFIVMVLLFTQIENKHFKWFYLGLVFIFILLLL